MCAAPAHVGRGDERKEKGQTPKGLTLLFLDSSDTGSYVRPSANT